VATVMKEDHLTLNVYTPYLVKVSGECVMHILETCAF